MVSLNFEDMWNDPIIRETDPGAILGGQLIDLGNYCCVRVSHALMTAGHTITQPSDFKDKYKRPYIIKCDTMDSYLRSKLGPPIGVSSSTAAGKRGIIFFKKRFRNATGHFDLFDGSSCAYSEYWDADDIYLWEL